LSGMATLTRTNTFLQRLVGAAALDSAIYEEVEADPGATAQAMAVVVMSSLAMGIGATGLGAGPNAVAMIGVVALLTWAAWALLMFEVGVRLLPGRQTRSNPYELLRTIGFSATPGMLAVLGAIPGVAVPAMIAAWAWMVAAMVVAVRQALDYEHTSRAIAVCVLGLTLAVLLAALLGLVFGPVAS
jgi:hypothetical protein